MAESAIPGVGALESNATGGKDGTELGAALVVGALDGGEEARSVGDADGAAVMIVHSSVHAPSTPFWSPAQAKRLV
eukprot:scaffold3918_cov342-Pinguiococcus_pyrenoidosus.AAC.1